MNKNLYKVKTSQSYNFYYVMAQDYNDAESKVKTYLTEIEESKPILNNHGDLNFEYSSNYDNTKKEIVIEVIELLTAKLII